MPAEFPAVGIRNGIGRLRYDLDIIVGLKGRYKKTWDRQIRPVPPNSRLITLSDALQSIETARLKCTGRKVDPCVPAKDMPALRTDFVQSW